MGCARAVGLGIGQDIRGGLVEATDNDRRYLCHPLDRRVDSLGGLHIQGQDHLLRRRGSGGSPKEESLVTPHKETLMCRVGCGCVAIYPSVYVIDPKVIISAPITVFYTLDKV